MNDKKCLECTTGRLKRMMVDWPTPTPDGNVVVPDVVLWRCGNEACLAEVLPPESSRYIEQWVAEHRP
jgi:hypothetical protein